MDDPNSSPLLSAAECAARTGLSPRALRLYEEHGLIKPGRSAGGWRQYGAAELIRLDAITLLKAAGLTLGQIAAVVNASEHKPSLEQLLTLQLHSWKGRRADAERGQRIAEAALERLNAGHKLTVDDLCNLIRSLEMTQPPEPSTRTDDLEGPSLDPAALDRYAGLYQAGEWAVITVQREGAQLQLVLPDRPPLELRPTSDSDFESVGPDLPITFDHAADGTVSGLRLRMRGGDMPAARIDAHAAEQVRNRLLTRIAERKPLPGSEAAARRLLEGILSGAPPYEEMHPALAYATRWQLPHLRATSAHLGAIRSFEFQGVGSQGWDVYDVNLEHGTLCVRIVLRPDGQITGALLVIKDGPVSLGP